MQCFKKINDIHKLNKKKSFIGDIHKLNKLLVNLNNKDEKIIYRAQSTYL